MPHSTDIKRNIKKEVGLEITLCKGEAIPPHSRESIYSSCYDTVWFRGVNMQRDIVDFQVDQSGVPVGLVSLRKDDRYEVNVLRRRVSFSEEILYVELHIYVVEIFPNGSVKVNYKYAERPDPSAESD